MPRWYLCQCHRKPGAQALIRRRVCRYRRYSLHIPVLPRPKSLAPRMHLCRCSRASTLSHSDVMIQRFTHLILSHTRTTHTHGETHASSPCCAPPPSSYPLLWITQAHRHRILRSCTSLSIKLVSILLILDIMRLPCWGNRASSSSPSALCLLITPSLLACSRGYLRTGPWTKRIHPCHAVYICNRSGEDSATGRQGK